MNQKSMTGNLKQTFDLTELAKNLSVAMIIKEQPELSITQAEIFFWKEVRRIKDIASERYQK